MEESNNEYSELEFYNILLYRVSLKELCRFTY